MSTRGIYGFKHNNKDILLYNHFDSYPGGLGVAILSFIEKINIANDWNKIKENLSKININSDGFINEGSSEDILNKIYENKIQDIHISNNFILDSIFCEYAYIINLDNMILEYYIGFQKIPQENNRFGEKPNDRGWYPCRLSAIYDINFLNSKQQEHEIFENMEMIKKSGEDSPTIKKYYRKYKLKNIKSKI